MPEIGTSGSMSGDGKRGVADGPSYRAHPRDSTIATNFTWAVMIRGASRVSR